MAGIEFTFEQIAELISALSPILIAFFLFMLTCMNQNFKGLVFIAGAILALFINMPIMNAIGSNKLPDASASCSIVDMGHITGFNSPSNSTLFIAFTIAYLFIPMFYNNQLNYPVIIILLGLLALDSYARVKNKCTTISGSVLGGAIGFFLGWLWFSIFQVAGADSLLYFNDIDSNAVRCSRPAKQNFKCSVYKDGQLVATNIA